MQPIVSGDSLKEKLRWGAIGAGLQVLASVLMWASRRDALLGRAIRECRGTYRFESRAGDQARHLVFAGGKVSARKKRPEAVHFTFTLRQPDAFSFSSRPDQLLEILIGNKIVQTGNLYYVYQLGFILSLLERYFTGGRRQSAALPFEGADPGKNLGTLTS